MLPFAHLRWLPCLVRRDLRRARVSLQPAVFGGPSIGAPVSRTKSCLPVLRTRAVRPSRPRGITESRPLGDGGQGLESSKTRRPSRRGPRSASTDQPHATGRRHPADGGSEPEVGVPVEVGDADGVRSRSLTHRAGVPAYRPLLWQSLVTNDPAAIRSPSSMCTPGRMVAAAAVQHPHPIPGDMTGGSMARLCAGPMPGCKPRRPRGERAWTLRRSGTVIR